MNTVTKTAHLGGPAVAACIGSRLIDTGIYAADRDATTSSARAVVYRSARNFFGSFSRASPSAPRSAARRLPHNHPCGSGTVLAAIYARPPCRAAGRFMGLLPSWPPTYLECGPRRWDLMRDDTLLVAPCIVAASLWPATVAWATRRRIFFAALVSLRSLPIVRRQRLVRVFWLHDPRAQHLRRSRQLISVFNPALTKLDLPTLARRTPSAGGQPVQRRSRSNPPPFETRSARFPALRHAAVVGVRRDRDRARDHPRHPRVAWPRIFPELPKMARL